VSDGDFTLLLSVYAGSSAEQLREAVESSVHRQTLRPDAVMIVEDGPVGTDVAAELDRLEATSPVPMVRERLERNVGLAAALNAGIARITTTYVARMDADDISAPDRFERQLPVIRERRLDILGSALAEFHGTIESVDALRVPPIGAEIEHSVPFRQPFNHPTVIMRRAAVLDAGGYPTDVGRFEDYVLFARMLATGAAADNLVDPLLFYRVDDGAYHRRGGWRHFRSEVVLQRELRRIGITTRAQWLRNVLLRGPYRLVPVRVRAVAYRRFATRSRLR
jgi:glycosyltransferase involved in cell wall biosynthesis